jgi:hypothetical protein
LKTLPDQHQKQAKKDHPNGTKTGTIPNINLKQFLAGQARTTQTHPKGPSTLAPAFSLLAGFSRTVARRADHVTCLMKTGRDTCTGRRFQSSLLLPEGGWVYASAQHFQQSW